MACFIGAGAYWGWRISTWWRKTIGVYADGLAFVEGGETKVLKWTDLAWIKMFDLITYIHGVRSSRYRRCEIAPGVGEPFSINSGVAADGEFYDQVARGTFTHFWRLAAEAYNAGDWVDFGPIRINKSLGLELGGKRFEWNELAQITTRNGRIQVVPQRGKFTGTRSVAAHRVRNVSVCLRFVEELLSPNRPPV